MKKFVVLVVMMFLIPIVSSVVYAREPQSPEQISTWTLSPNPAGVNATLTTNIAFSFTSADATTRFCVFGPNNAASSDANWLAAMPDPITLRLSQGFTSENVSFARSDGSATCGASRSALYIGTYTAGFNAANSIDVTTSVGSSVTLSGAGATAGTSNWTLLLEEQTGTPGSIGYSLELTAAPIPNTGLSGTIIDTKSSNPWAYGAEVLVTQMTGVGAGRKGSTYAAADGTWSIIFGSTDDLSLCGVGCAAGNNPATYKIEFNYRCDLEIVNGIRPSFASSTDGNCPTMVGGVPLTGLPDSYETTVPDTNSGVIQNVGSIQTVTGPTAVTLQNVTAGNNTTAIGIGFVVLMLAGVTFVMFRRREIA